VEIHQENSPEFDSVYLLPNNCIVKVRRQHLGSTVVAPVLCLSCYQSGCNYDKKSGRAERNLLVLNDKRGQRQNDRHILNSVFGIFRDRDKEEGKQIHKL
jgi:hypothetical protein